MRNKSITIDSTVLLREADGVGDSRILIGFRSMIEAEAVTRARKAGYVIPTQYCHTGELGIDIIGETSLRPNLNTEGKYTVSTVNEIITGNAIAALTADINGLPRRAAAQNGLINLKPTWGTVSRYGLLPIAPFSDTVTVTAANAQHCRRLFNAISAKDEKDPTTVQAPKVCRLSRSSIKLGIPNHLARNLCDEQKKSFSDAVTALRNVGAETAELTEGKPDLFRVAHTAFNTLLCASAWGNTSRYDGVRYGKRSESYQSLGELYTASRSEGFGSLAKSAILYGSYVLSPESGEESYFKAQNAREWVKIQLDRLFESIDAIVIPTCSVPFYTQENMISRGITAFNENFYTAIASLCGLPTVTVGGVQIVGRPFTDGELLDLAESIEGTFTE